MGVEIKHVSRWLNGIAMTNMNDTAFQQVLELSFTDTLPWEPDTDDVYFPPKSGNPRFEAPLETPPGFNYGIAREQTEQVRVNGMHELGYTGKGVWIGVLDAGFFNMDSLPSFIPLYSEGRILGERNYVDDRSIYELSSSHGMSVSSIMAGEWDGNLVGTAPHANYLLCSTENSDQETRIEEIAWIEAAEYADSLGVDVLNTSLGYSDFDGEEYDYSYEDMDGSSTYISRAASMCASRGLILCSSAGNSGDDDWYYITAPADAAYVLAVGAVDSTNFLASFSSRGPSYDARIKPDITAMGLRTGVQYRDGRLARGNGTSFASPVMAGSVASLWQAFPDLNARDLIHMVRQSGHRSKNPDSNYGFGTPNILHAYHSITRIPVSMNM
jgi:subtilisin family serine protease